MFLRKDSRRIHHCGFVLGKYFMNLIFRYIFPSKRFIGVHKTTSRPELYFFFSLLYSISSPHTLLNISRHYDHKYYKNYKIKALRFAIMIPKTTTETDNQSNSMEKITILRLRRKNTITISFQRRILRIAVFFCCCFGQEKGT